MSKLGLTFDRESEMFVVADEASSSVGRRLSANRCFARPASIPMPRPALILTLIRTPRATLSGPTTVTKLTLMTREPVLMSAAAIMRAHLMRLYSAHLADGMIPTSNRFLVYELIQEGVIDKKPTGILKPGAKMQRRTDQNVIDALTGARARRYPLGRHR